MSRQFLVASAQLQAKRILLAALQSPALGHQWLAIITMLVALGHYSMPRSRHVVHVRVESISLRLNPSVNLKYYSV